VLGAPESDEYEPVAVTVRASVGLSLEDLAAGLVDWDWPIEEPADDAIVRFCRDGDERRVLADRGAPLSARRAANIQPEYANVR
jgi:hypothetical protein